MTTTQKNEKEIQLARRQSEAISWLVLEDKEFMLQVLLDGVVPEDDLSGFLCAQIEKQTEPIRTNKNPSDLSPLQVSALVLEHTDKVELFEFLANYEVFAKDINPPIHN